MPSVATGAVVANRKMIAIGVSGDGDTGAIGIGQFVHLMRRNLPIVYIIEDNGCYGLTKGQFSPTADLGSTLKTGVVNDLPPIDTCALAIELGASFVARSFSGDPKQLKAILKAALSHRGTCMIDVLSPCVTFNDHEGSTKSYSYAKDHEEPLGDVSFVPFFEDINVEYDAGTTTAVTLHNGSKILLSKLAEDYNPTDKMSALRMLHETACARRVRHRHPLRRAGQAGLHRPARHRGRAARHARRVEDAAGQGRAGRDHGELPIVSRLELSEIPVRSSSISGSSSRFARRVAGGGAAAEPAPAVRRQARELRVRRRADRRRLGAVPGRLLPGRAGLHRLRRARGVPVSVGAGAPRRSASGALATMVAFLAILSLGWVYAYRERILEWK